MGGFKRKERLYEVEKKAIWINKGSARSLWTPRKEVLLFKECVNM